ncbi:unnamed protein product [Pleuronectes platessa]|uniref:Uncharacterized protein n=1 Tax=Pleuronectes platessa TaxID=8262 RepID=A0A9N7UMD2_PLEPL|nr:unnamed protein product [Pleuronectes platessa]
MNYTFGRTRTLVQTTFHLNQPQELALFHSEETVKSHVSPTHLQMIPTDHLMQSESPGGLPSTSQIIQFDHVIIICLFTCLSALPETCLIHIGLITACHAGLCILPARRPASCSLPNAKCNNHA